MLRDKAELWLGVHIIIVSFLSFRPEIKSYERIKFSAKGLTNNHPCWLDSSLERSRWGIGCAGRTISTTQCRDAYKEEKGAFVLFTPIYLTMKSSEVAKMNMNGLSPGNPRRGPKGDSYLEFFHHPLQRDWMMATCVRTSMHVSI